MRWFCNYCKEEHDSRDPSLFPPETFVHPGVPPEHEEWVDPERFGKTAHVEYVPGSMHKGLWDEAGNLHMWPTAHTEEDWEPSHTGYAEENGLGEYTDPFVVHPNGTANVWNDFDGWADPAHHAELQRFAPGLKVNEKWSFSKTAAGPLRELHSYYDELKGRTAAVTKPPNLRESKGEKACFNCWAYKKGRCEMFGGYKVREDQVCDDWESKKHKTSANNLLYDSMQHPEGKGFILDDNSVWTWPTENLKPMHMQYAYKAKQQGHRLVPGSAFHIKDGQVWQYGPGRSLSPEQHQLIIAADPSLSPAPPKRQEQLDASPGYGHGQNVLDILERGSSWIFRGATNIHDIAWRIYEKALEGVGSTINLHGESPSTRFGFAPDLVTQTPFPLETFSPADVEAFIARFSDRLREPDKFVGSWIQGDEIIMDVTEGSDDYQTAYERAWNGHQQSMWDSQINDEVPVRGLDYDQTPFLEGNE
jgi:hypothetical protein